MLLKYTGKRKRSIQSIAHQRFVFCKENDYTQEVEDNIIANILIKSGEFLPTFPGANEEKETLKCKTCGFQARRFKGFISHKRWCDEREKNKSKERDEKEAREASDEEKADVRADVKKDLDKKEGKAPAKKKKKKTAKKKK